MRISCAPGAHLPTFGFWAVMDISSQDMRQMFSRLSAATGNHYSGTGLSGFWGTDARGAGQNSGVRGSYIAARRKAESQVNRSVTRIAIIDKYDVAGLRLASRLGITASPGVRSFLFPSSLPPCRRGLLHPSPAIGPSCLRSRS